MSQIFRGKIDRQYDAKMVWRLYEFYTELGDLKLNNEDLHCMLIDMQRGISMLTERERLELDVTLNADTHKLRDRRLYIAQKLADRMNGYR